MKLDAYESDLPWLRYGQEVEFTTEAYPGEVFTGTVAFIDPVLEPEDADGEGPGQRAEPAAASSSRTCSSAPRSRPRWRRPAG